MPDRFYPATIGQPASMSADVYTIFTELAALYKEHLPQYGVPADYCWDWPPRVLTKDWAAGPQVTSYPTIGQWTPITATHSPTGQAGLRALSDIQTHPIPITTLVAVGVAGEDEAALAIKAASWLPAILAAWQSNTNLLGAVQELIPGSWILTSVTWGHETNGKPIEYYGLLVQCTVQARWAFTRS